MKTNAMAPLLGSNTLPQLIPGRTYSGDRYSATADSWHIYRLAVKSGQWDLVEYYETGQDSTFVYDP